MNRCGYSNGGTPLKPTTIRKSKRVKGQPNLEITKRKRMRTQSQPINNDSKRNTQKIMRTQTQSTRSKRKINLKLMIADNTAKDIINKSKREARRIIKIVNEFLEKFHIVKEFYKPDDDTYVIYLYVKHKREKIYFFRTSFSINELDNEDIDRYITKFTASPTKRQLKVLSDYLMEEYGKVEYLHIQTTHCIVNKFNFTTIIQSYVMAKLAILKNVFIGEKDDMTDMAASSSMKNFNHFLGFFNEGELELAFDEKGNELIHATDSTKYAYIPNSLSFISENLHEKIYKNEQIKSLLGDTFSRHAEMTVSRYNETPSSGWRFNPPVQVEKKPIKNEVIFWE